MDGDNRDCCVCATCVSRLRDASAFRQQVLQSEQVFLNARMESKEGIETKFDVSVKAEPISGQDSDSADDRDDSVMVEPISEKIEAETKIEPQVEESKEPQEVVNQPKTRGQTRKHTLRRDLLTKMHKLRKKLDHMLDEPKEEVTLHPTLRKEKSTVKAKKKDSQDHDTMTYNNAVTIVQNSFVCPFHNRTSNYYCYYCKDQFVNPNELREHTLTHDPRILFENMMENKKIPKIDITRIDCRLCPAKIDDVDSFKSHITSAHGKVIHPVRNEFLKFRLTLNNLTCTECGNTFPYFDSLKKHMIDHFGTFICDMCGACFLEQNSLRTHIKSHNKVESNFPCEICGKNLKSKYSRYLHIATVHEKKPTVNCYKCEASFLSYALRNRHLIEVHGDKRTFPCKLCDKVYNRRKTLMEHNRRNHLKVYRHQCDLCDQRFYLPSRLKEHMATHTGERNFRCEFCDKSYPRLQSLQEHIRSHSNERRYKCDLCNSAFTQNGSLKNHMKTHHQGFELETFS